MNQERITLLIVEDHTLLREAWAVMLGNDPRFQVIAETGSSEKAIDFVRRLKPDVVLLDINIQGMNGMDTIPYMRQFSPETAILGVSLHTQPVYARKMMDRGAMGYLTKNSSGKEMFEAIVEVH